MSKATGVRPWYLISCITGSQHSLAATLSCGTAVMSGMLMAEQAISEPRSRSRCCAGRRGATWRELLDRQVQIERAPDRQTHQNVRRIRPVTCQLHLWQLGR